MADIATLGIQIKSNISTQVKNLEKLIGISDSAEKAINKLSSAFGDNSKKIIETSRVQKENISSIEKMILALQDQEKKIALTRTEYVKYKLSLLGASDSEKQLADMIVSNISKIQSSKKAESDIVKSNAATYKKAMSEQQKAIYQTESAEKSRNTSIQAILESLKKEELRLTESKESIIKYNLALLGASETEKKAASEMLNRINAINDIKKAEQNRIKIQKDAEKEINEAIKKQKELDSIELKRKDSINNIILKLRDEAAIIGKSKTELTDYKLKLLGASDAERSHAKALAEKAQKLEEANNKSKSAADIMSNLATKVSALAAAYFGVNAIKNFANEILNTAKIADNFKYSLLAVSDSSEQAAETYQYLEKEANRLGQSMTANVDSFTGFIASAKAAGLTADQSKKIYTGLNEAMTALHRTPEQASQAIYALQQMLSSGTVKAQELNIQLANAIPGAVPMFAQAMGKTTSELKNLMKEGLVPSNEAVIKFTDYLSNKFGPSAEAASNSVQGSLSKMDNALYNLKKSIVEAMGDNTTGIIKDATNAIINFTESLKTEEGQEFIKNLSITIKEAASGALSLVSALGKVLQFANLRSLSGTMEQAAELSKKGMIDIQKFATSSALERQKMVDDVLNKEEQLLKTQNENIKYQKEFTESIIETSKESKKAGESISNGWQPIVGVQAEVTDKMKENEKTIKGITEKLQEQLVVAGKTGVAKVQAELEAANATDEEKQSVLKLAMAIESKENASKNAQKAARKAEQEAESAIKKAESAEKARQDRINEIIKKLKDQIATYQKGKEVSAEVALQHENATPAIIAYAKALGKELDHMKAVNEAQKEYDALMSKTAPDQVEIKRANALEIVQKQFDLTKGSIDSYANSIAQVNKYYDDLENKDINSQLKETTKTLEDLYNVKGTNFGNELADGINNAITSMHDLNDVFEDNIKIQKNMEKAQSLLATGKGSPEERAEATKTLAEGEEAMTKKSLSGYRQLFGTISQLYGENTKEREALHKIEMAFAAAEIAMNLQKTISNAYVAITGSAGGDPYTAFARVAAMAALMAGIVSAAGGSLGGTKGGGSASASSASSNGGTVLGSSEGSQSISNSLDFMTDIQSKQYNELKGINDGVESLNKNITGLVTSIVRNVDVGSVSGAVAGTSGGTSYTQDMGVKYASSLMSLGTSMWSDFYAGVYDKVPILGNIISSISDFVDDAISGITNAVFGGSKKTSILAQGLEVSTGKIGDLLDGMGVDIQKFADIKIKKEGGLFGSDKTYYKTLYEALGDENISRMFTNVFKSMGQTMVAISKELSLGDDNISKIFEYTFDLGKLDLKGLDSEGINKVVSEAISAAGDTAVQALFGELISQYQQVGEGLLETAIRVVSEKAVVEDILGMTNQAFADAKIPEIALATTQSIIDLAGGIKELQEISSTYYNEFFSDAEKQTRLYSQLNDAMTSIGLPMAENRDAFRSMVEGLDLSTESGRQQYVTLLSLSEAADKYYDAIESGEKTTKDNTTAITNMVTDTQKAVAQMDMTDFEKSIQNVKDSTENQVIQLKALGGSEEDVAAIRSYGQKQIEKLIKSETDSIKAQKIAEATSLASKQMELDILNGVATQQDKVNVQRQQELKTLPEGERAIQQQIWARQDEIEANEKAAKILDEKSSLELRIFELTSTAAEYTAKKRQLELDAINETNKPLQERIYQLEDESIATAKAKENADKKQSLEIELLNLTGKSAEAVAIQRQLELANLDEGNKVLQKRVWALQDEQSIVNDVTEETNKKYELELQLLNLTGKAAQATAIQREKELLGMNNSTRILQKRIWALEDEAAANEKAKAIADERLNLEIQLLEAQGKSVEAVALQRQVELSNINESNKSLQERVWALQDEKDAAQKLKEASEQLAEEQKQLADNIANERLGLENELLSLLGKTDELRKRELSNLDASNRSLQTRIWALQDEKEIQELIAASNNEIMSTKKSLENELLTAMGNTNEIREQELEALKLGGSAISDRIEALKKEQSTYQAQFDKNKVLVEDWNSFEEEYYLKEKALNEKQKNLQNEATRLLSSYTAETYQENMAAYKNIQNEIRLINKERNALTSDFNTMSKYYAQFRSENSSLSTSLANVATDISKLEEAMASADTEGLVELQKQIWALEDAAKAAEKATAILEERYGLELSLLQAEGKDREYTLALRAKELEKIDESNRWIQERIWQLEDEKTAIEETTAANEAAIESLQKAVDLATSKLEESITKQIQYYQDLADAANLALDNAKSMLDRSLAAEQERLTKQHESLIDSLTLRLNEAETAASSLESVFNSLSEARKSMEGAVTQSYRDVQAQLFSALESARSGDFSKTSDLIQNIGVLTGDNQNLFATEQDYKRNFYKNYAALSELESLSGEQLSEQQQIIDNIQTQIDMAEIQHESSMNMLQDQYDAVLGVDKSVMRFEDAVRAYQRAQYEADGANTLLKTQTEYLNNQLNVLTGINNSVLSVEQATYDLIDAQNRLADEMAVQASAVTSALTGFISSRTPSTTDNEASTTIPGYANGGIHEGGLRIVGERGAEIEYTAPARITSNTDLKSMMSDEDIKRILSEIKEEIARGNFTIAKNTQDSAKTLKKFDYDGMPTTRTE